MDEPLKLEAQNINNPDSLNSNEKQEEKELNIDQSNNEENNQNFEIEIEKDKTKTKKKFSYNNKRSNYNYSKSPSHMNNNINNKIYSMVKVEKPFLTSKYVLLNKYSLKEVNECIYKDYNQIANILPYYQNYYFQNRINNYNNYKNSNYNSNNNDSILICLKYIEYTNFFFNNDISYKIQNLLFNIINGDRNILEQNKYTHLKNKLHEVYNKLIPYHLRHNYLKAFYERNTEDSLYYLFKRDLDKISMTKPINIKNLKYLYEIYEIVKQKMGNKKDIIKAYINKLFTNTNSGVYNNMNMNNIHNHSYSDRKQSFNQYSSNNNNISSFNYHNNINDKELGQYNINNNKDHNFKGSYPTKHNNHYFYKNRNNSYFKQELIEVDDRKNKINKLNSDEENNNININKINNDEHLNLMSHNNLNNNNGNIFWNNNININNINLNSLKTFVGNMMPNNNINLNLYNNRNPIPINMNNINNINNINNLNGNMIQNNLYIQNNNANNLKNIPKKMKINLPPNNMQNNIKEEEKGNINTININNNINVQNDNNNDNKDNKEDNNIHNEINDVDILYSGEDDKNKENSNSDNNLPKVTFYETNNNDTNTNNDNTNKNISLNDPDLNYLLKQMNSTQNYLTTNINKYISQFTQFNINKEIYKTYILIVYNQGIINNISFLSQNSHHNSKNNYNHNGKLNMSKQEKIIETEYEKLRKKRKEKPEQIEENLKLFENYIILPIYNEINTNNNNQEIIKKYSDVYFKYKEVINYVIEQNKLEGTIVEPYGSIVNNFLTSDGDIDISIVPNNISKIGFRIYLEQIEKELVKRNLIEDIKEINDDININNNSRIYISTRYTLLSVTDIETNINIDITVHNLLPIKNTEMIRLYSLFDQRFHILGIFLKHWVKINNIKGSPNHFLSSYALLLLVIHFLQDVVEPKILPMLQEIIPKDKNKNDFDYTYFYGDKEFSTNLYYEEEFDNMRKYMNIINCEKENESSVSELLVQFFEYYGYIYNNSNYNKKHYLISVKHSDKNFIANNTELIAFPLEDPFDVNHNPSSSLKFNTPQYSEFIFCMRKEINNILGGEYFK